MLTAVLVTLLGVTILLATARARQRRIETERLLAERSRREVPALERTAAHEAGHAILAWVSPKVIRLTTVTTNDEDGNGVVRFDHKPLVSAADLWDCAVIGLAGIAGEGVAFGVIKSSGAQRDLQRALAMAERIADMHGAFPWEEPRIPTSLDVANMFAERPSPAVAAVLNAAYRRAKAVIAMRPDKFDALRAALLARGRLEPGEIEAILGPRPWAFSR